LENWTIDARSAGEPVPVQFAPNVTLLRSGSDILTQQLVLPPTIDIVGGLLPLPQASVGAGAQLEPQCGVRFGDDHVSSFVITGSGGTPPEPAGWLPNE